MLCQESTGLVDRRFSLHSTYTRSILAMLCARCNGQTVELEGYIVDQSSSGRSRERGEEGLGGGKTEASIVIWGKPPPPLQI